MTGYDSTAATAAEWRRIVPTRTPAVIGSYANGRFANTTAAKEAFPHARHITYDVNGWHPEADILDVEPGDASPGTAPGWARAYRGSLPLPGLYCSASTISAVVSAMLDAGFKRDGFLIQSAHYTFTEHICGPDTCGFPQADATQYQDKGLKGENTDLNVFSDHFFGAVPPPKPDPHYERFDTHPRRVYLKLRVERQQVRLYDQLRATQTAKKHPHRVQLAFVRKVLGWYAGRVYAVAHEFPDKDGKPSWDKSHRGWRYQQLSGRAAGDRFV